MDNEFKFVLTCVLSFLIFITVIIGVAYFYTAGVFHQNQLCVEKFGIETCREISSLSNK